MGAGEPEEEGPGCTDGPGPYRERSPERSPAAYLGLTLEGGPQRRLATSGGHRAYCSDYVSRLPHPKSAILATSEMPQLSRSPRRARHHALGSSGSPGSQGRRRGHQAGTARR
jgi:hypothetical protein